MPNGTKTIIFIKKGNVPKNRKLMYAKFVCNYHTEKEEKYRTRIVVGRNLVEYSGDVSTPTADTSTARIPFNSIVSTKNAQFMGINTRFFYLNTPMKYTKILLRLILEKIINQHNLLDLIKADGYIYTEVRSGM